MLRSIKLQFNSHRDIYGSTSIWSSQFTIPYILFILAWHSTLLVHVKQAIIETKPISSTHVSFVISQTYLLSHDAMISHNIYAISLISLHCCLPWSSNTTIHNFDLHLNTMWNTIKFACLLNLGILVNTQSTSICNILNFLFNTEQTH